MRNEVFCVFFPSLFLSFYNLALAPPWPGSTPRSTNPGYSPPAPAPPASLTTTFPELFPLWSHSTASATLSTPSNVFFPAPPLPLPSSTATRSFPCASFRSSAARCLGALDRWCSKKEPLAVAPLHSSSSGSPPPPAPALPSFQAAPWYSSIMPMTTMRPVTGLSERAQASNMAPPTDSQTTSTP